MFNKLSDDYLKRSIGDSDVGDIVMLVAKKYVGDIFLHVRDIPFGYQHHIMSEDIIFFQF